MTTQIFYPLEDGAVFVMARVLGTAGTAITQASLTSIAYKVTRMDTEATVDSGTLTIANVVFDTLQTTALDPRWTADSTGYNFGWLVPATTMIVGGIPYNIDLTFTPTAGAASAFGVVFRLETIKRYN